MIFVPFFLLLLFAILYFGQVGVKQERAQHAIRYGIVTLPAGEFKIEQMYAAYQSYDPVLDNIPLPPLTPAPCPGSAVTQTQLAMNNAETVPTSAPSAQPYWSMPSPSVTCKITFLPVSNVPDMYNVAMSFINETQNNLSGTVPAPSYLVNLLPHSFSVTAQYAAYLPATLDEMLSCTIKGAGGHGTTSGDGMAYPIAEALGPGTDMTGQGALPYYAGYDPTGFSNANKLCNEG